MNRTAKFASVVFFGAAMLFSVSVAANPIQQADPQQTAPDNSKMNRDNQSNPTADQQKENSSDRAITQKIRKAIHQDKSLSMYAHNVKIITRDGKVTLRGPVKSDEEKSAVETKAAAVVGNDNVTSEIEVKATQ